MFTQIEYDPLLLAESVMLLLGGLKIAQSPDPRHHFQGRLGETCKKRAARIYFENPTVHCMLIYFPCQGPTALHLVTNAWSEFLTSHVS